MPTETIHIYTILLVECVSPSYLAPLSIKTFGMYIIIVQYEGKATYIPCAYVQGTDSVKHCTHT